MVGLGFSLTPDLATIGHRYMSRTATFSLITLAALGAGAGLYFRSGRAASRDKVAEVAASDDEGAPAARPSTLRRFRKIPHLITPTASADDNANGPPTSAEAPPTQGAVTPIERAAIAKMEATARKAGADAAKLTPDELNAVSAIFARTDARRSEIEERVDPASGGLPDAELTSYIANTRSELRELRRMLGAERARALRNTATAKFSELWRESQYAAAGDETPMGVMAARRIGAARFGVERGR